MTNHSVAMMMLRPALLSLVLVGCITERPSDVEPPPAGASPEFQGESVLLPLVADRCDEPTYAGIAWESLDTGHFTLQYLPGTAAARDRIAIAARLERAYTEIHDALAIDVEPRFTVNLSPNRAAAVAHDRGFGTAWPEGGHYDVIYTGAADSYEMTHYGQLLAQMLDYHVDRTHRWRLPLLATGVAEYFDQSGRDAHETYARELVVAGSSAITELDPADVDGTNTARAASLVQFLVERYGMSTFRDLYTAMSVRWTGTCFYNAVWGCVSSPAEVAGMLDYFLFDLTGDTWSELAPRWHAAVTAAVARMPRELGGEPAQEITNLVRIMNHAADTGDASAYRSTIEGYYCDLVSDAGRDALAERAVATGSFTQLVSLHDAGIKSFSAAQASVVHVGDDGIRRPGTMMFERIPELGWRVTASSSWY